MLEPEQQPVFVFLFTPHVVNTTGCATDTWTTFDITFGSALKLAACVACKVNSLNVYDYTQPCRDLTWRHGRHVPPEMKRLFEYWGRELDLADTMVAIDREQFLDIQWACQLSQLSDSCSPAKQLIMITTKQHYSVLYNVHGPFTRNYSQQRLLKVCATFLASTIRS